MRGLRSGLFKRIINEGVETLINCASVVSELSNYGDSMVSAQADVINYQRNFR